ncbi:hypothetical protein [Arthrobacter sp. TMN-50]
MAGKTSFVQRFMKATGRARAVFGPAQSSSLDHPMTQENQALLKDREAEASQWETVKRPDGSTYIVPKS